MRQNLYLIVGIMAFSLFAACRVEESKLKPTVSEENEKAFAEKNIPNDTIKNEVSLELDTVKADLSTLEGFWNEFKRGFQNKDQNILKRLHTENKAFYDFYDNDHNERVLMSSYKDIKIEDEPFDNYDREGESFYSIFFSVAPIDSARQAPERWDDVGGTWYYILKNENDQHEVYYIFYAG